MNSRISILLFFAALLSACASPSPTTPDKTPDSTSYYTAEDFASVPKIDAHIHVEVSDSAFMKQAIADNFRLFSINYDDVNEPPPMEVQQKFAVSMLDQFPQRYQYATTVSIRKFNEPNWTEHSIDYIKNSLAKGAKAVKIYKVFGMSLRDKRGKLVMVDDPRLDSLFSFLENNHIPVVGHLGEPRNCWLPAEKMTVRGDSGYFSQFPIYHMYKHPEMPTYEDQIHARDNRVAKNPGLTFVGAHLGSLEWNVDSLAARLDRFPNMAVDMAARIVHLNVQARDNWQKVHDFLIQYSDRLLYATDLIVNEKSDTANANRNAHETWTNDWKFFTLNETMTSDQFNGSFKGMKLPKEVIDKIYYRNAEKWLKVFSLERQ